MSQVKKHCQPQQRTAEESKNDSGSAAILEKLAALPESLQTEVLHYIEFLAARYSENEGESDLQPKKRSSFGIWQGKVWMADDFDAPLEAMKDYR